MKGRLSPRQRTVLWVGSGAFLGAMIGGFLTNASRAERLLPAWLFAYGAFLAALWWVSRRPAARPEPLPVAGRASAPRAPEPLTLRLALVDVPEGHPPVVGANEPLRVRVAVTTTLDGAPAPAAGAALRLVGHLRDAAKPVAAEGVAGEDGSLELALRPPGVGELLLDAEASLGDLRGKAHVSVSIVRYDEEIQRLFGEFRAYAHQVLGPDSASDTARELAEKLRVGADAQTARALLELARIYELVAYGAREAGRPLYLQLIAALLVVERAPDRPSPAAAAAPPGG